MFYLDVVPSLQAGELLFIVGCSLCSERVDFFLKSTLSIVLSSFFFFGFSCGLVRDMKDPCVSDMIKK